MGACAARRRVCRKRRALWAAPQPRDLRPAREGWKGGLLGEIRGCSRRGGVKRGQTVGLVIRGSPVRCLAQPQGPWFSLRDPDAHPACVSVRGGCALGPFWVLSPHSGTC